MCTSRKWIAQQKALVEAMTCDPPDLKSSLRCMLRLMLARRKSSPHICSAEARTRARKHFPANMHAGGRWTLQVAATGPI